MLTFGVLILGAVATHFNVGILPDSRQTLRDQIIGALGTKRFEGRLASSGNAVDFSSTIIPKNASKVCQGRIRGDLLGTCALLDLAEGHLTAAISKLEDAAATSSDPVAAYNDLAVANIAQAQAADSPHLLVLALLASRKALHIDEASEYATFNYALALEKLGLRDQSLRAWTACVTLDRSSVWSEIARAHLTDLKSPSPQELWNREKELVLGQKHREQTQERKLSLEFPQPVRQLAEEVLFGRWAAARSEGDLSAANYYLATLRSFGSLRLELWGDPLLKQSVAVIDRILENPGAPRIQDIVLAHLLYRRALEDYQRGRVDSASEGFEKSREALRRAGSPFARWATFQLALCAYQHSKYPMAREMLASLVTDQADPRYPVIEARSLWVMGLTEYIEGDLTKALEHYSRALPLFEKLGEKENVAAVHGLIAENLSRLGDFDQSWRHLGAALQLMGHIQDPRRRQLILEEAADTTKTMNEPAAALQFEDEAIGFLLEMKIKDWESIAHALQKRSALEADLGFTHKALEDIEIARKLIDRVVDPEIRLIALGDLSLSEGRLLRVVDAGRSVDVLSKAIEICEQTRYFERIPDLRLERALSYLAIGADAEAEQDLRAALADTEAQRSRIPEETLRAAFLERSRRIYDQLIRLDVLHRQYDRALETLEGTRSRVLMDLVTASGGEGDIAAGQVGVSWIQRSLPSDAALVEYGILQDQLLIWIVQPTRVDFVEIPVPAARLKSQIAMIRETMVTGHNTTGALKASKFLFLKAIDPVLKRWKGKRLILVPDKDLIGIPFAALLNPATERYLVEDYEIGIAPSARLYARSVAREQLLKKVAPTPALVVGDPAFNRRVWSWLTSVSAAGREAKRIASLLPGAKLLSGSAATREAFLRRAREAVIIHYAGHAVVDREAPLLSGLVLAPSHPGDSGLLYVRDLFRLHLKNARLVVLSACDTGTGKIEGSEGVIGLARPFLAAGAPALVASLWTTNDSAAAGILEIFYLRLLQGDDSVAALRAAQLNCLYSTSNRQGAAQHWAAFEHIGAPFAVPTGYRNRAVNFHGRES